MKKLAVKAQLKLMEIKSKIIKKKGEVNTIEMLVLLAVFLLLTYPAYGKLLTKFWSDIQNWFTGQTSSVFHS